MAGLKKSFFVIIIINDGIVITIAEAVGVIELVKLDVLMARSRTLLNSSVSHWIWSRLFISESGLRLELFPFHAWILRPLQFDP